jgi:hypothetical protein
VSHRSKPAPAARYVWLSAATDEAFRDRVYAMARRHGYSASHLIRDAVAAYLKAHAKVAHAKRAPALSLGRPSRKAAR